MFVISVLVISSGMTIVSPLPAFKATPNAAEVVNPSQNNATTTSATSFPLNSTTSTASTSASSTNTLTTSSVSNTSQTTTQSNQSTSTTSTHTNSTNSTTATATLSTQTNSTSTATTTTQTVNSTSTTVTIRTNQTSTSTQTSLTNVTAIATHTENNVTSTISTGTGQNASTKWDPYTDFYNFINYGLFNDDGDCYGFSSTAVLYFQHYQLGDQSAPFYPEPTSTLAALPGQTGGNTLSLSTFPIYIHQTYDPSEWDWIFTRSNLATSVQKVEQNIRNGMPVVLGLGPSHGHAVVAYAYEQHPNGTVTIMISDPNYGNFSRQAQYTNGQFLYEGTYTWTTFNVLSPGPIHWSWLLLKGVFSAFWSSTVSQTNPYYTYVFSSVPITLRSSSGWAYFGTPGNSLTFNSTIAGVVGFEEGGIQVYGIPLGIPYQVRDPGTASSQLMVIIPRNNTSVVGYQLDSSSTGPLNLSITPGNNDLTIASGSSLNLSVSFFSAQPHAYSVFNVTSIPVASSQTAAFTVPNWDRLNSTQSAPTLQVFEPSSTTPVASYTLANNQQGLPQPSSATSFILQLVTLIAVSFAGGIAIFLYAKRRKK